MRFESSDCIRSLAAGGRGSALERWAHSHHMSLRVIILAVLLSAPLVGCVTSNPLRRSDDEIRSGLEKTTPLGSTLSDVQTIATQHGWYHATAQGSDGQTTGTYIRGELGNYGFPFRTSVTVFWEFDASYRLDNIRIWRTTDSM